MVAACELLRGGAPVRIVDKLPEPSPWSKAVVVHARSLELLEAMGVADRFVGASVRTAGASLVAGGRTLAEIDFSDVDSPYPFAASLPQDVSESILRDALAAVGGEIERPVELVGLAEAGDGVAATLRHRDGSEETATFSYVVGADGGHSSVRGLVGARLEGTFDGESFLLADCDADHGLPRDRIFLFFAPQGVLALFPLPGKRCRLAAQLPAKPQSAEPTLDDVQRISDERTGGVLQLANPRWLTFFEIHEAQVPAYRVGRAFLAGDAAHVHSPAGGQGMNTGIQDAYNLAWKLRLACSGAGAPGLLDSYQAERHPIGAHVVRMAALMTDAATRGGATARQARTLLVSALVGHTPLRGKLAKELTETTVAYRESPIVGGETRRTVGHGPLHPGDLAPVVGELARALDPLAHTALLLGPVDVGASTAARLRSNFGELVRTVFVAETPGVDARFDAVVADEGGAIAARYGAGPGLLAIVRPDRYLAYLGDVDDVAGAERILTRAIG